MNSAQAGALALSAYHATAMAHDGLRHAVEPLPRDRVLTLRTLLRITDELRAHILGGRIAEAGAAQTRRDALLHQFFEQSVLPAERTAMMEACSAMLDMDHALLSCLEIKRSSTAAHWDALDRDAVHERPLAP